MLYDNQGYLYLTTTNMGYRQVNQGLGGRAFQQLSAGDSSIVSKVTNVPVYTAGSILILESPNDLVGDTTVYTTSIYSTQMANAIPYLHNTKGYPYANIVITTSLAYNNYLLNTRHGSIPYRHSIYLAANNSLASTYGIKVYDGYVAMRPTAATDLAADSIHLTPSGNVRAATLLATYLQGLFATDTITKKSAVIGNQYVMNNIMVGNQLNTGELNVRGGANLPATIVNSTLSIKNAFSSADHINVALGSNTSTSVISLNANKSGNILGYRYADTTAKIPLISYVNSSTNNDLNIGTDPQNATYGFNRLTFSAATSTSALPAGVARFFGNSAFQIGGTLPTTMPTNTLFTIAQSLTSASASVNAALFSQVFTAGANNQGLYALTLQPTMIAGTFTGVNLMGLRNLVPQRFENITDPVNLLTGRLWGRNNNMNFDNGTSFVWLAKQTRTEGTTGQIPVYGSDGVLVPTTGAMIKKAGQVVLAGGVATVTITGLTTASTATTGFVSIGGTVATTWQYKVVCTANTLTITAITNTGSTNTDDTSTLNYFVTN